MFVEIFSGSGNLTSAVRRAGLQCMPPNDLANGGTDFESTKEVEELKAALKEKSDEGFRLVVHLAPPCSTFSRARDRSEQTKVRSKNRVAGILPVSDEIQAANRIALRAWDLAVWLADSLNAKVSLENPQSSYLWEFLDQEGTPHAYEDVTVSMCRYGADYNKDTRLRWLNGKLDGLDLRCSIRRGCNTCGKKHLRLGFEGEQTESAAAYPAGLCVKWAKALTSLRCK